MRLFRKHNGFLVLFMLALPLALQPAAAWAEVKESILANGMKVLLVESPKAPVVTVQIWYKVGSRNEIMGRAGLSHMLEHMMFKGTPEYPKGAFSKLIRKNGGNDNAFTSQDFTAYFENLASDRLELALKLEADRLRGLLLDDKEFQLEREVVKEERRLRIEDDPQSFLVETLTAQAFMVHPYHWPIIGWFSDLNAMTRADLKRHYDTYYVPNNSTLVIVGDIKTETVMPLVKRYFESIPNRPVPPADVVAEPEQRGERRLVVKREAQLPFVIAAYRAPNYTNADAYALTILESILAHGKTSRLYQSLVYEQKRALAAGCEYDHLKTDPDLIYCFVVVRPGQKTEDVEQALYQEIYRIQTDLPSDRELQRAKNEVEAAYVFGKDSTFRQAMVLGQAETVGAGWQHEEHYVERIRAVTPEDIRRVARQYLIEDGRTVGVLIPTADQAGGTQSTSMEAPGAGQGVNQ